MSKIATYLFGLFALMMVLASCSKEALTSDCQEEEVKIQRIGTVDSAPSDDAGLAGSSTDEEEQDSEISDDDDEEDDDDLEDISDDDDEEDDDETETKKGK